MTDATPPSFFTPVHLSFPPAERIGAQVELYHSPHQGLYGLNVVFVARRPDNQEIDRVLRECTAVAAAHDDSIDIFVSARFLPSASADPDRYETLEPYGRSHFLCWDAQARAIGLRRIGGDEDMDDATEDMVCCVREWVWYGFHSPADIDALIDRDADDDGGFDVDRVKAFAAETLAEKRAAEAQWPPTTDNDKLDRVFAQLLAHGVCALQYVGNTMDDGFESLADALAEEEEPDQYIGYCFFHSQDMDRALDGQGLMLAFGHLASEEPKDAVLVGRMICDALRAEGFDIDWDESPARRIGVPKLRWQRRTPA